MRVVPVQRECPDRGVIVRRPGTDDIRDRPEVLIDLYHMLIDQIADQLIGVVGGNKGIERVVRVGVQREHVVHRFGPGKVFASGGLGDLVFIRAASVAAGGKRQNHHKNKEKAENTSHLTASRSGMTMQAAWPPRIPLVYRCDQYFS